MAKNTITYGLNNAHYSVVTETVQEDGSIVSSYGDYKPWNGAVKLTLNAKASVTAFRADNRNYAMAQSNTGYEGEFECADIPEDVLTEVFSQVKTTAKGVAEYADRKTKYIAFACEFDGDAEVRKFVFYKVMLTKPDIASETTKEDSNDPITQTVKMVASPRPDDGLIKYFEGSDGDNYASWYSTKPVVPAES